MQNEEEITIQNLIKKMKRNNPKSNTELIMKAYDYAQKSHEGQKRMSGEEYIVHPLSVAYILAAFLHDVVEDTEITHEDIVNEFGEEIADMVEGVTKLRKNSI